MEECTHKGCQHSGPLCQTLEEMDFERGPWSAGKLDMIINLLIFILHCWYIFSFQLWRVTFIALANS